MNQLSSGAINNGWAYCLQSIVEDFNTKKLSKEPIAPVLGAGELHSTVAVYNAVNDVLVGLKASPVEPLPVAAFNAGHLYFMNALIDNINASIASIPKPAAKAQAVPTETKK